MISVIVPVYNAQEYIAGCIESIVSQTLSDWEMILVDDGSTDNSAAICDQYAAKDSRITVIHQKNSGVSAARNAGIIASKGISICFADADDLYFPHALEILSSGLTDSCDISCAQFIFAKSKPDIKISNIKWKEYNAEEALGNVLYQRKNWDTGPWAKLYRRELFDKVGLFKENIRYEDLEIIPRLYAASRKIAVTDIIVYFYRDYDGSFMHRWSEARLDSLKVVDDIYSSVSRQFPELTSAALSRRFSAYYNIVNLALVNGENQIARRYWPELKIMSSSILKDSFSRFKNRMGALICKLPEGLALKLLYMIAKISYR